MSLKRFFTGAFALLFALGQPAYEVSAVIAATSVVAVVEMAPDAAQAGPLRLHVTSALPIASGVTAAAGTDSRTDFGGAVTATSGTWATTQVNSNGYWGWWQRCTDNKVPQIEGSNFAMQGSTDLRLFYALSSVKFAATGNPAQAQTLVSQDANWNQGSAGVYGPLSSTAPIFVLMPSFVNDQSPTYFTSQTPTPIGSMLLVANILDQLTASGKIVLLGDEMPSGTTFQPLESRTPNGSNQFTPVNTTNFRDGESFSPNPEAGAFDQAGNYLTKVGGAPAAANQYSLSGTTYTTFPVGSGGPSTVYINYRWSAVTTNAYVLTGHEWLKSAAANFTSSGGTNYGIPGALYNRPRVFPFPSWEAVTDPNTSGTTTSAYDGGYTSALHPGVFAEIQMCGAYIAGLNSIGGAALPSLQQTPTKNNAAWGLTTAANKGPYTYTGVGLMAGPWVVGSTRVRLIDSTGVLIATDNGAGGLVGTGIDPTSTINDTTGAVSIKFTANPTTNSTLVLEQDFTNLLANGMLDPAQGNGTAPTCTGYSGDLPPSHWALTFDAALTTACNAGLIITTTRVTESNGAPGYRMSWGAVSGGGIGGGVATFQPTVTMPSPGRQFSSANGDRLRGSVNVRLGLGPNGHIAGLQEVTMLAKLTSSVGVVRARPCSSTCTVIQATIGSSAGAEPYSDISLKAGQLMDGSMLLEHYLTNTVDTSGTTPTIWTNPITITCIASVPCSGTVDLSEVAVRVRTN